MEFVTREEIIKSTGKLRIEKVEVTEWFDDVDTETGEPKRKFIYVKELSAAERDRLEQSTVVRKSGNQWVDLKNYRAKLAIAICCDQDGNPLFKAHDVDWLMGKSTVPFERIAIIHKRLNTMEELEEDALKN